MFYKNITNGYIMSVSVGNGDVPITEAEYHAILNTIPTTPPIVPGYTYMLRADTLEWELVEIPPEPEPGDEEANEEDYIQVLDDLGVRLS